MMNAMSDSSSGGDDKRRFRADFQGVIYIGDHCLLVLRKPR